MSGEWFRGPSWSSPAVRTTWEPRLEAIVAAWGQAEVDTVLAGLRPGALLSRAPGRVADLARQVGSSAQVVPLEAVALSDGYSGSSPQTGAPGLRVALTRGPAEPWHRAIGQRDDDLLGELLGFPACCRRFFARTWGQGMTDTTWPQAAGEGPLESSVLQVAGSPEASVLLRWLGVRLVPHLPCSFDCQGTLDLGRRMAAAIDPEVLGWTRELLDAPTSWTARHGAAEVRVEGLLRFYVATEYSATELQVSRRGSGRLPSVDRDLVAAEISAGDNGFGSSRSMLEAHQVLEEVACRTVADVAQPSVLDLGAGDGALLARLGWAHERIGVELSRSKVLRGRARWPAVDLRVGRIEVCRVRPDLEPTSPATPVDLALLMPGRLLEWPADVAEEFRARMPGLARRWLVYTYDRSPLEELASRAGLKVTRTRRTGPVEFGTLEEVGALEVVA